MEHSNRMLGLEVVDVLGFHDHLRAFIGKNKQSRLYLSVDINWKDEEGTFLIVNITPKDRKEILNAFESEDPCCWWDDVLFKYAVKPATFINAFDKDPKIRRVKYDVLEKGEVIIEEFLEDEWKTQQTYILCGV